MPTKRTRRTRARLTQDVTPEELQWLTGVEQPGASKFWHFRRTPEKVTRCRALLETHAHLVPRGRMRKLKDDLHHWDPPAPTGLASFRRNTTGEPQ